MNNHEIMAVLGKYKDKLLLTDEDIQFLNEEDDEDLLIEYLRCLFSGVILKEVKEMKAHGFTPDLIRRKAGEILGALYREEDVLTSKVHRMQERLEVELSHAKEVNVFYKEQLLPAWEAERKALEAALSAEREVSARLRHEINDQRTKEIRKNMGPEDLSSSVDVPVFKPKKKRFFRQHSDLEDAVNEQYKQQKRYEERQFRDNVLMNPEYSEEQKKYLLSCFNEGMSYWTMIRFAHPGLPVDFMQALKERREKGGY